MGRIESEFDEGPPITVCVKTVSSEIFGHMSFASFEQVNELGAAAQAQVCDVHPLPVAAGCDFVFDDLTAPAADDGGGSASAAA